MYGRLVGLIVFSRGFNLGFIRFMFDVRFGLVWSEIDLGPR